MSKAPMPVSRLTSPKHEELFQEVTAVLRKYADNLTAMEILAVLSNMVGKVVAMQDQRKYNSAQVLKVVSDNIELGNKQALEELHRPRGNA